VRPSIATVVGPDWEPALVERARSSGTVRVVGRCCDEAGLLDIAARADVVFIGSETHWLARTDLRSVGARVIGVASDSPGARLLYQAGANEVVTASVSADQMLAVALNAVPSSRGRIVEVTGTRGAPGRSEVALALAFAGTRSTALVELDHAGPSLGLRMGLSPSKRIHSSAGVSLVPAPLGTERPRLALIESAANRHSLTILDGGPGSQWHQVVAVDDVVVVGEATDVGVVRLARLCETWLGPQPSLIVNRYRPGQDLALVVRATGLEPAVVIPEVTTPTVGAPPDRDMRRLVRPLLDSAHRPVRA
jgi:hypothetical protein